MRKKQKKTVPLCGKPSARHAFDITGTVSVSRISSSGWMDALCSCGHVTEGRGDRAEEEEEGGC